MNTWKKYTTTLLAMVALVALTGCPADYEAYVETEDGAVWFETDGAGIDTGYDGTVGDYDYDYDYSPDGFGAGYAASYDEGFDDGFAEDDWYWYGFDDSWDTRDGGDIYYYTDDIPYIEDDSYDAGYWDGVWYAYNDGYFVAYDYAFVIGFSEGYDAAFWPNWYDILASDAHVEWYDGGFSDGYNDGFSEGRVFGAWDYAEGWEFDWLYALDDYRAGTDLGLEQWGTGVYGPVVLYEYGTDPAQLLGLVKRTGTKRPPVLPPRMVRSRGAKSDDGGLVARPLTDRARGALEVRPATSARGGTVRLQTTWLERIRQAQSP